MDTNDRSDAADSPDTTDRNATSARTAGAADTADDRTRLGVGLLLFGIALLGDALAGGGIVERVGGRRGVAVLGLLSTAAGGALLGSRELLPPDAEPVSNDREDPWGPGSV
jgi:hypothetical protein